MATKQLVTFVDDTDGTEAAGTILFALDRVDYEIDLSEYNAEAMRKALAPFVASARKAPAIKGRGRKAPRPSERNTAIREWAASVGIQLAPRGRIPAEVTAKYELAQYVTKPASPPRAAEPTASPDGAAEPATEPASPNGAGAAESLSARIASGNLPLTVESPPADRNATIRKWAKQRGIKVAPRGRIPANVVSEYEAQTGDMGESK